MQFGDIVILSNRETLGVSEDEILHEMHTSASKLMVEEKRLRDHVKNSPPIEIVDKAYRNFSLLQNAKLLETEETISALSMIKLSLDLGWISGVCDTDINALYFSVRRAALPKK